MKGKKHGSGLEITNKFIYQGQYLNGKKNGIGKYIEFSSSTTGKEK
jgi:hypothetical protein